MPERWERELDELRQMEMREPAIRAAACALCGDGPGRSVAPYPSDAPLLRCRDPARGGARSRHAGSATVVGAPRSIRRAPGARTPRRSVRDLSFVRPGAPRSPAGTPSDRSRPRGRGSFPFSRSLVRTLPPWLPPRCRAVHPCRRRAFGTHRSPLRGTTRRSRAPRWCARPPAGPPRSPARRTIEAPRASGVYLAIPIRTLIASPRSSSGTRRST